MNRGTVAEIDLDALSGNLATIKRLTHNRPVIAVVKADAYGHGALEISRRLSRDGVAALAVAFTGEAKMLREAGVTGPLLVLFDPDVDDILRYDLTPVIADRRTAEFLAREAERRSRTIGVHIKLDTGMGRLGLSGSGAVGEILAIAGLRGIVIEGMMSHFSEADLADVSFATMQIERFNRVRSELSGKGVAVRIAHMANSAAVMTLPEAHLHAVRPGIMLYGYSSIESPAAPDAALSPVMTVKARIVALRRLPAGTPVSYGRTFVTRRESLIGVISAGYADGFSRRCSNNADVLVRGRRVPVAGRVCMDLTMVDLTDLPDIDERDEAVIIGRQGDETIDAAEVARRIGTIPYEILLSLGSRAKRVYNTST